MPFTNSSSGKPPTSQGQDGHPKPNLAPQGEVHIDDTEKSNYTPEGDAEPHPNIPPDATEK